MAKKSTMEVDTSEVISLTSALSSLEANMRTNRHLNSVTRAAYEVLAEQFNIATHAAAQANVEAYHHVYEWEHVGIPGFQLWKNQLNGQGGQRRVTWGWRASKTTVPTEKNVDGSDRFQASDKFNPKKLNRIHVFVWKAPIMEYGTAVNVSPKLSHVLVFPNPDLLGGGRFGKGPRPVTFTPHPVRTIPGHDIKGNFTAWFVAWWGGGPAQVVVDGVFSKERDKAFRESFEARIDNAPMTKRRNKSFRIETDAAAAREGKNIARAIAGDMEHFYIEMARERKRKGRGEGDDD